MEQLSFLLQSDNTNSGKDNTGSVYCLFNGEHGVHTFNEMRISKTQYETTAVIQERSYTKFLGKVFGDFEVLSIEYDWGKHKQVWAVRCKTCGEISYKPDGYQWSRGKMYSRQCKKCRDDKRDEKKKAEAERKECNRIIKENRISDELGKIYGKFEVIDYKGNDACKVRCTKCGAERRQGVTISKLQSGIYPSCDCGRPKYSDAKWIGSKVGHLTVISYEGGKFICRCDCGRERVVVASYFAQKRYWDCAESDCIYMSEARGRAIAARDRGNAYEGIAEALIKSCGYKTKRIGKTGDYGVDIIAIDQDGMKIAVQCKSNMAMATGVSAVQQVYAGGRYYGLGHFAVISHSGYSGSAIKMARRLGVYLSDGKTFIYPKDIEKYANELIPTTNAQQNIKARKLYELNGQRKTLENWAFEFGTSCYYVRAGLNKGLSLENALKYRPNGKRKTYTYKGFEGTIPEICEKFSVNVTIQTIRNRINKGLSIEEAIDLQTHTGRPAKVSSSKMEQLKIAL